MAHEQAKALVMLGHEVAVFAGLLNTSQPRYGRTSDIYDGITVHRIGLAPEDYSPEFLNFFHPKVDERFQEILESFKPEIVHCHNILGLSVRLPILATQSGAATVCTLHDLWGFCLTNTAIRTDGEQCRDISQCRSCIRRIHDGRKLNIPMRFRKDMMRIALDHVDRFVSPSQFIAKRYIDAGLDVSRVEVLPNGINALSFCPPAAKTSTDDVRVTYVGYFGAHKGVETLLDALAVLSAEGKQFILQLVGEGPACEAYKMRAESLGLLDRVQFLGKVETAKMPAVYARSEIVVLPSIWDENQPVCIMEAMAAGVPVVASRKGGIPELIKHGENGLMFAAGDARDLADRLSMLIDDSTQRRAMGDKARECIVACSHERQARRLLDVYAEAIRYMPVSRHKRKVYVAVGGLKHRILNESEMLDDHRFPSRSFVPWTWIADVIPVADGLIFTGLVWSILQRIGINAMLPLPRIFRKLIK